MPVKYGQEYLVKMSEYIETRNKLKHDREYLISIKELNKLLDKTNFLLKCFSQEKIWLDMMFDP
jgi:hypothetical protein